MLPSYCSHWFSLRQQQVLDCFSRYLCLFSSSQDLLHTPVALSSEPLSINNYKQEVACCNFLLRKLVFFHVVPESVLPFVPLFVFQLLIYHAYAHFLSFL